MIRPSFSAVLATFLLLPKAVSGAPTVEAQITGVECSYRAITPTFDYICNEDAICVFGEDDFELEGTVKYTGLERSLGENMGDYFYLDATLSIGFGDAAGIDFKLLKDSPVPVCISESSDCPSDGSYQFNTTFNMPSLENPLLQWSGPGWQGDITLILWDSTSDTPEEERYNLGECVLNVDLVETGKTLEESDGKLVGIAAFFGTTTLILLIIGYVVYRQYFADGKKKKVSGKCKQQSKQQPRQQPKKKVAYAKPVVKVTQNSGEEDAC